MAGLAIAVVVLAACGKKGPPQPPLRPVPDRIADLKARYADGRVELTFTVPPANADGTTPAAIERVEIYRLAGDVAAPPAPPPVQPVQPPARGVPPPPPPGIGPAQIVQPANLRATILIRLPQQDEPAAKPAPAAPVQPAAGEIATFVDDVPAGTSDAVVWRYVAIGVAGRNRRSQPSPTVAVPLGTRPTAPSGVRLDYNERELLVAWTAAAPGDRFVVLDATDRSKPGPLPRLTAEPVPGPTHSLPVVFGRQICVAVRTVSVSGAVTTESVPSDAVCETPVDKFPPPAPTGLIAQADQGAVSLVWGASSSLDLAGYLVLRTAVPGDTLQPLMTTPIAATSFRDTTVRVGATYIYAVVAVDKSGNRSSESNRQTLTVTAPTRR